MKYYLKDKNYIIKLYDNNRYDYIVVFSTFKSEIRYNHNVFSKESFRPLTLTGLLNQLEGRNLTSSDAGFNMMLREALESLI